MPLTIKHQIIESIKFDYPFRIFISGSSQSGKTYFARELLKNINIFDHAVQRVKYYHPDFLTERPVNWHESLDLPISYQSGLPTMDELCNVAPHTCLVIDDLYEECINSKAIDYLFRVLSGKRNLCVMIMSQRYFAQGRFAMNIRNNCNFTVLMRNVDSRVNTNIARLIDVEAAASIAMNSIYSNNYYPYLFIDSTPRGQVTQYRCYISVFGPVKVAFDQRGMKGYIISERDYLDNFYPIDSNTSTRKNGSDEKIRLPASSCQKEGSGGSSPSDIKHKIRHRDKERRRKRLARSLQQY